MAAHGLQGLHAFLAAQGLQGLQAFLAAHGLQGLHAFLAAQGLQGLHDAATTMIASSFTNEDWQGFFFLAPHGLHGLHFLAAQGLQGLQAFLAAQGLHAFLAAHGLQGLQDANAASTPPVRPTVIVTAPVAKPKAIGKTATVESNLDLLDFIFDFPPMGFDFILCRTGIHPRH